MFKALIQTTEGAVVLGGLVLTVLSPVFSAETWAIATGVAYTLINIPSLIVKIKSWFSKKE
tara:strand:+ start:88 stop:270 length:183 start_codon:yes stop_codon:yes gene_type:complete